MQEPIIPLSKEKINDLVKEVDLHESIKSYLKEERHLQVREAIYNHSLMEDIKLRGQLTNKIYFLVLLYVTAAMCLIYLTGLNIIQLTDAVMVTLLTTTLGSVIGLLTFIVKYFFKSSN